MTAAPVCQPDGSAFATAEAAEFRRRVRAWLEDNLPPGWATDAYAAPGSEPEEVAFLRSWQRRLFDGGWAGLSWPKEYGGGGASLVEQAIYVEERDRVKAPTDFGIVGTQMVGPMLIRHGTPEQCERFLHRILTGEDLWCQGFSEPDAGSDLAALRTRAVPSDRDWVINGQKVWTSRAQYADMMILLARSDLGAAKHRGITAFAVPMGSEGIRVRPLRQANGSTEFCEVFLEDVLVPGDAVIGGVNRGWDVAVTTLSYERLATTRAYEMRRLVCDLVSEVATSRDGHLLIEDPVLGDEIARHICEAYAGGAAFEQMVSRVVQRGELGADASAGKLYTSELGQRIVSTALAALPGVALHQPVRPWRGSSVSWTLEFTNSLKNTIAAGTSQIQRNLIGERILGLPRGTGR